MFDNYPKKYHFYLKDIFNDYWDNFLRFANSKNLIIRDVVHRDNRMMICNSPELGSSVFKCPECGFCSPHVLIAKIALVKWYQYSTLAYTVKFILIQKKNNYTEEK